jgi:hypothetical protein
LQRASAEARKRTAYGTADCRAADRDLLAHHVLSYARLPEKA